MTGRSMEKARMVLTAHWDLLSCSTRTRLNGVGYAGAGIPTGPRDSGRLRKRAKRL